MGRSWAGAISLDATRALPCGWGLSWTADRARVSREGGVEVEPIISSFLAFGRSFSGHLYTQLPTNTVGFDYSGVLKIFFLGILTLFSCLCQRYAENSIQF